MAKCEYCNKETSCTTSRARMGYGRVCMECAEALDLQYILKESEKVNKACDFKGWDHGDLSDLFWYHLGEYIKDKNPEIHFPMMKRALFWAMHDSHGLSSSFTHALKWAKVSIDEVLCWTC